MTVDRSNVAFGEGGADEVVLFAQGTNEFEVHVSLHLNPINSTQCDGVAEGAHVVQNGLREQCSAVAGRWRQESALAGVLRVGQRNADVPARRLSSFGGSDSFGKTTFMRRSHIYQI
jgi:hypothetical protein